MISIVFASMPIIMIFQLSIATWVARLSVMAHRSNVQKSGGEGGSGSAHYPLPCYIYFLSSFYYCHTVLTTLF